jgi:beta-carotene hydroxylase
VFGLQLAVFFLVTNLWLAALLAFLLMLAQISCGAICHNHHHVNIFTRRPLNRALEVIMYLQTGTSPYSWTIHHNIGHHHEYLHPQTATPRPGSTAMAAAWRACITTSCRRR